MGFLATLPLRIEERRGAPMSLYGRTIQPIARVTRLRWPGGVWEWHRPVAVVVREGGAVRRVPIRDVSRLAIASLAMVAGALAVWTMRRRQSSDTGER